MKKEKELYLEVLRILAVLLVIFNHTDGFFLYFTNTGNPLTYAYSLVLSVLCRINVPIFFMISGALLLRREESFRQLFQRRILRIGSVLILFSAVQYGVDVLRGHAQEVSLSYLLRGILSGGIEETYWYLYAYLGMLLLLPFLRILVRGMRQKEFRYLLLLELVFVILLPTVSRFTQIGVPGTLYEVPVNVFYMLAGCYLAGKEHGLTAAGAPSKGQIWAGVLAVPVCVLGACSVVYGTCLKTGSYTQESLDAFTPLLAVVVFETVRVLCSRVSFSEKVQKGIVALGSCTFGIYLTEQLVRILLLPLYLYLCKTTVGVIACTVYVVGTYVVALLVTAILKRFPVLKRLL